MRSHVLLFLEPRHVVGAKATYDVAPVKAVNLRHCCCGERAVRPALQSEMMRAVVVPALVAKCEVHIDGLVRALRNGEERSDHLFTSGTKRVYRFAAERPKAPIIAV